MHSLNRRAWVDIDLGALLRNAAAIAEHAGIPLLPMVKADAYGLGGVRVARTLDTLDPWGFGVSTVIEGAELRRAGITRPVLIFTPLLEGDFDGAMRAELIPALGSASAIQRWSETRRPWHLAIDTGMSRAGVQWNEVAALRDAILASPPEGVFTHFHSAEREDGTRALQETRFREALAALPLRPPVIHAENSPAIEHGGASAMTVCRPGVFLYGVSSGNGARFTPEPVVGLRARIVDLRTIGDGETVSYDATWRAAGPRRIATLAIGYADGYRRAFSNGAPVLVRGRRCSVAGLVTMDMTMIDVTDVPCEIGDAATLIGDDGDDAITVNEIARAGNMSPYEVLTGLHSRLARRYLNGAT
jgi:alanine racemase